MHNQSKPRPLVSEARRALIDLVLPVGGEIQGARAVKIREAIEDLEDAGVRYGRELERAAAAADVDGAPPVTAAETAAAQTATAVRTAELLARLRRDGIDQAPRVRGRK